MLGPRLTPSHWSILRLLLEYPLLYDDELAAFLSFQRRTVRCLLYVLHLLDCLEPVVTEVGKRWHLRERGLRLLAAANHIHVRNFSSVPADELGNIPSPMIERGAAWLLQHIEHTDGVYGFFASLAQAARQEPGHALCWWKQGQCANAATGWVSSGTI